MANTASAKKAIRSSARKRHHNLYWKDKIKGAEKDLKKSLSSKSLDVGILNTQLSMLQKMLDKAAKQKVIHKNKANRLKARYAQKITVQIAKKSKSKGKPAKPEASAKKARAKKATKSSEK
jgi:small subunit ribosomal protein S20